MLSFKTNPEDFQVEERLELTPGRTGEYSYYRLVKRDMTTWRAVREIAEAFKLTSDRVAVAGLKDKVAVATQHVSVAGGPPRGLEHAQFRLEYLGAGERPIDSAESRGNRFTVVLREAGPEHPGRVTGLLSRAASFGLPNYFDSQRFGSLRGGGDFAVRRLLQGDALGALQTVLCTGSRHDHPAKRRQRRHVAAHWGDWAACLQDAAPMDRRLLETLQRFPAEPARAYRCIPHKLRLMFLHAYQSFLYNEILGEALRRAFPAGRLLEVHYLGGMLVLPREPDADIRAWLEGLDLPLPAPGVEPRPAWKDAADAVLARERLSFEGLRFPDKHDGFFRALARPALFLPEEAGLVDPPGETGTVRVRFSLPPGTYATVLLKWLQQAAG